MRTSLTVLLILVIMAIALVAYYYPELPDPMASHFNGAGQADGWSSKGSFLTTYFAIISITLVMFVGIAWGIRKIPISMINLPKKDYWLAPGRKNSTLNTLSAQLTWIACLTLALFLGMFYLTIRANLSSEPNMGNTIWVFLGLYLAFDVAWLVQFIYRFQKTP